MKLLMFQARRFAFAPHPADGSDACAASRAELRDAAVVFVHAEAEDEPRRAAVLSRIVKNIKWLANKRGLRRVVLHSFSHLSESKSSPAFAGPLIDDAAERLRGAGYEVSTTPFGRSCAWELDVYGEPVAKVFKSI
jgi:hypothetical protein